MTQLFAKLESIFDRRRPQTSVNMRRLLQLIREAEVLDRNLDAWCGDDPIWLPQTLKCYSPADDTAGPEPQRIDIYSNMWILRNWNLYRTARMEPHKTLLDAGSYLYLDH